jgi:hypothetical protein
MLRSLWTRLIARFKPIAPFVLDTTDQLELAPENFLCLQADDSPLIFIRPMSGHLAMHGVGLVFNVDTEEVAFHTFMFQDGVELNIRERRALRDSIKTWLDGLDETHDEMEFSYGGSN